MKAGSNQRPAVRATPQTGSIRKKATESFELRLTLSKSETECRLSLRTLKPPLYVTIDELIKITSELGVTSGINKDVIADCCRKLIEGQPVEDILIASGCLPEKGTDASVQFLLQASHKPVFTEDRTGHVDFHETHLFDNVLIGHEIAILHPAVPGKPGLTVTGKTLPVPPAKDSPLRAGDGVEFSKPASIFLATKDGYVIIKNNLLQVRDEYLVDGDLDFHTGNLNFEGKVHVRGDVLDGFHIKATRDIRIEKNAGHCRFESGGNMEISGMNGLGIEADISPEHGVMPHPNTTGTILCKGNLTARYLHHVYVECEGNLHVTRELMHSVIHCAGSVTVDGRIIGGSCTALAGIESLKVGTEMGIQTELIAGEDYREAQQETQVAESLDHLHREREILMQEVGPGPFTPEHMATLSPNIRLRTMELLAQIHQLDEQTAELRKKLTHRTSAVIRNPKINILRELYFGAILQLDQTMQKIPDLIKGPVSIIAYRDELQFLPISPLAKLATELQKELRDQEQKARITMALGLGIEHPEKMEITDLIRAIQTAEGNQPCFCIGITSCPNTNCCWLKDCKLPAANKSA